MSVLKSLNFCHQTYQEEGSDQLLYDVHFWIGKYSTQVSPDIIRLSFLFSIFLVYIFPCYLILCKVIILHIKSDIFNGRKDNERQKTLSHTIFKIKLEDRVN